MRILTSFCVDNYCDSPYQLTKWQLIDQLNLKTLFHLCFALTLFLINLYFNPNQ